ncbi:MAG: Coq4 family protein [Maribacter sp.]
MRAIILEKLYEWSLIPYQSFKSDKAWDLGIEDLLQYSKNSLGYQMGYFLLRNNFDLQEKLESHDVFHVLTGTGTSVPEEISMQFYLLGNGKRSIYLLTVIFLGALLFPDYFKLFRSKYRQGKSALAFYQVDFYKLLDQPIERIKNTFLIH